MKKVEKMMLHPGTCAVTGRSDGPAIDTGITIPPGRAYRIYLRENVVKEMAGRVGMVDGEDYAVLQDHATELEDAKVAAEDKLAEAKKLMDAWLELEPKERAATAKKVTKKPAPKKEPAAA